MNNTLYCKKCRSFSYFALIILVHDFSKQEDSIQVTCTSTISQAHTQVNHAGLNMHEIIRCCWLNSETERSLTGSTAPCTQYPRQTAFVFIHTCLCKVVFVTCLFHIFRRNLISYSFVLQPTDVCIYVTRDQMAGHDLLASSFWNFPLNYPHILAVVRRQTKYPTVMYSHSKYCSYLW